MQVILVSTYELGRQPFGLASPAAWLRAEGHEVACIDLSRTPLAPDAVCEAGLVAFYLPMHTATRLALKAIPKARVLNPRARICCYGLYAPVNEAFLRELGVESILGGEFERGLVDLARGIESRSSVSLARQQFRPPDRSGLPPLSSYARLLGRGEARYVGSTEASRGCKHLCRHCPVVPVYRGVFRIVQQDVVLEDIRRQVSVGAQHITFGDPDFFNGPGHARAVVEALHAEHPTLTYDVTIKIEHLLKHRRYLPELKRTGCLFVTSAVESVDNVVLEKLDKGHTRQDFIEVVRLMREAGLTLAPTFIPFNPWTTWEGYRDLLSLLTELDLIGNTSPIQLAIRLLIPAGSRLMELEEIGDLVESFDSRALYYPWKHSDPSLDRLSADLQELIKQEERKQSTRAQIFSHIWALAHGGAQPPDFHLSSRATIPYLSEPWYC